MKHAKRDNYHDCDLQVKERIQHDMAQARLRGFGKTLLFDDAEVS